MSNVLETESPKTPFDIEPFSQNGESLFNQATNVVGGSDLPGWYSTDFYHTNLPAEVKTLLRLAGYSHRPHWPLACHLHAEADSEGFNICDITFKWLSLIPQPVNGVSIKIEHHADDHQELPTISFEALNLYGSPLKNSAHESAYYQGRLSVITDKSYKTFRQRLVGKTFNLLCRHRMQENLDNT